MSPSLKTHLYQEEEPSTSSTASISSHYIDIEINFGEQTRPRVHFADDICQVVGEVEALSDLSIEDRQARYWNPVEFHTIRLAARLATRDVKKKSAVVEQIDAAVNKAQDLAQFLDSLDYLATMRNPSDFITGLVAWSMEEQGRGLERYISARDRAARTESAVELRKAVVHGSREASVEELAEYCCSQTKASVLYARMMGEADHRALMEVTERRPATPAPLKRTKAGRQQTLYVRQRSFEIEV